MNDANDSLIDVLERAIELRPKDGDKGTVDDLEESLTYLRNLREHSFAGFEKVSIHRHTHRIQRMLQHA